jgi:hypothetical protein
MDKNRSAVRWQANDPRTNLQINSAFLCISSPDSAFSVRLHSSVMDGIGFEIAQGPPYRTFGRQCAGILIGRQGPEIQPAFIIEAFAPVGLEDPGDESGDMGAVSRLLQSWSRGLDRNIHALGYYRTCPRAEQMLSPQDLALVRQLPTPALVLLIDASTRDSLIFVSSPKDPERMAQLEFIFDRKGFGSALPGMPPETPLNGPQRRHATTDAAANNSLSISESAIAARDGAALRQDRTGADPPRDSAVRDTRPRAQIAWLVAALAIVMVLAGVAGVWLASKRARRTAQASNLGLRLDRAGLDLRLTWDPKAPVIANAQGAVISIWEQGERRDVRIDSSQLRNGTLLYSPRIGDQVTFQLEVFGGSGSVSESALFIGGQGKLGPVLVHDEEGLSSGTLRPRGSANAPPPGHGNGQAEETQQQRVPSQSFQPPPERPRPLASSTVAPPSARIQESSGVPPGTILTTLLPTSVPARPPRDAVETSSRQSGPAVSREFTGAAPAVPPLVSDTSRAPAITPSVPGDIQSDITYSGPKATRKVMPILPSFVRAVMRDAVDVKLTVSIDSSGKVTGTSPVGTQTGMAAHLVAAATNAARAWMFEPARLNGRKVPSQCVLTFRFVERQ